MGKRFTNPTKRKETRRLAAVQRKLKRKRDTNIGGIHDFPPIEIPILRRERLHRLEEQKRMNDGSGERAQQRKGPTNEQIGLFQTIITQDIIKPISSCD